MIRLRWHRWAAVFAATVVLFGGSQLSHAVVVVQYSFEGDLLDTAPSGTTADNLTAYSTDGGNSVTYVPGMAGQAVRVSRDVGNAAMLAASDSADFSWPASFTIEAYVNPDSANTGEWDRFITKWFDAGQTGELHWAFRYANNGQDLYLNGSQNVINGAATGTVPLNQWSHVALTFDASDTAAGIKLWQDGRVIATAAYQMVTDSGNMFRIGNRDASAGEVAAQFSGYVDEVILHAGEAKDAAYMQSRLTPLQSQHVPTFENSDHSMAAGDFGIVYLDGAGGIRYCDGVNPPTVLLDTATNGISATRVAAAQLNDGLQEVMFVDAASAASLKSYNFSTITNHGGSAISDISVGDFYGVGKDLVAVTNTSGNLFFWTPTAGYSGMQNDASSLGHYLASGDFDPARPGDEFLTVYDNPTVYGEPGNVRIVSFDGTTITRTDIGGSGIHEVQIGNIYDNGGTNEIALNNAQNDGGNINLYIWEGGYYAPGDIRVTQITIADLNGDGKDEVYYIQDTTGDVYGYEYGVGTTLLPIDNNGGWSKLLAADLDSDGSDELYGLKSGGFGTLYRYTSGAGTFASVPEPGSIVLTVLGVLLGGVFFRRGRTV